MTQMTKDEIYAQAMALQPDEREALAEQLLSSLTGDGPEVIDEAWVTEARRREEAFRQGRMTTSPVDEVIARVQSRAKR